MLGCVAGGVADVLHCGPIYGGVLATVYGAMRWATIIMHGGGQVRDRSRMIKGCFLRLYRETVKTWSFGLSRSDNAIEAKSRKNNAGHKPGKKNRAKAENTMRPVGLGPGTGPKTGAGALGSWPLNRGSWPFFGP